MIHDFQEDVSWDLIRHGKHVVQVAWLPSGEQVATGSTDGIIRVGSASGEEPHLLYGHEGVVFTLAVDPRGRWLASSGMDGSIYLWPLPEGRPFHTLPHDEFLDRLRALTNYRVVRDETSTSGYRVELAPSPGWDDEVPTW